MIYRIVQKQDVSYLDKQLLDSDGLLKAVPAALLHQIRPDHLQIWANKNAVYQFATTELVDFLKSEIKGKQEKTIEICAGCGVLSRELGITGTDSYMQQEKRFRKFYETLGQQITKPPEHIKKYEAYAAVRRFRPEIVIGAFVTQHATLDENLRGFTGSPFGVREHMILQKVKKYILIGNEQTHAGKLIFQLPHRKLTFPWLISRCNDQSLNRIWIWENKTDE